jgi:hypothetical protein
MSKTKKPYDYIGELAMHWDVNMNAEPGVKRILRKLVRQAVYEVISTDLEVAPNNIADRIAKELVK